MFVKDMNNLSKDTKTEIKDIVEKYNVIINAIPPR